MLLQQSLAGGIAHFRYLLSSIPVFTSPDIDGLATRFLNLQKDRVEVHFSVKNGRKHVVDLEYGSLLGDGERRGY